MKPKILIFAALLILVGCSQGGNSFGKHKFNLETASPVVTNQLACKTIVDASVYQDGPDNEGEITTEVTKGTDNLALKINEKSISLITAAAVKTGFTDASEWPIIRNDSESLTAVGLQENITYTFTLNKQTGFAVWTKGQPTLFYIQSPSGFIQYLQCR